MNDCCAPKDSCNSCDLAVIGAGGVSGRKGPYPMTKPLALAALGFCLSASPAAFAAEKTVTLVVPNMYCASCVHIVKRSLGAVPGVTNVVVSFQDQRAVVTYDDTKTDVQSLTATATNALGRLRLTAWLTTAAYAMLPALVIGLGLVGLWFFRRRNDAARGAPPIQQQDTKP